MSPIIHNCFLLSGLCIGRFFALHDAAGMVFASLMLILLLAYSIMLERRK